MSRRFAVAIPTAGASTLCGCLAAILAQEGVDVDVLVIENGLDATAACESCLGPAPHGRAARLQPRRRSQLEPRLRVGVAARARRRFPAQRRRRPSRRGDAGAAACGADSNGEALLLLAGCGFSAMYLPRAVFEAAGPFDTGFWPAYFEDVDMHRRLSLAGIAVETVEAEVTHAGSASIGGDAELAALVGATFPRNRERYRAKWGGPPTQETFAEPWAGWPRGGPRVVVAIPTLPERADTCAEVVELYRERSPVPVDVVIVDGSGRLVRRPQRRLATPPGRRRLRLWLGRHDPGGRLARPAARVHPRTVRSPRPA